MTALHTGSSERVTGTRLLRREDPKLLTGEAKFIDDITQQDVLYMALLRSPMAHARIVSVDTSAAMKMPGVVTVFSGADLKGDWVAPLPCAWPVTADMKNPPHYPLAADDLDYKDGSFSVKGSPDKAVALSTVAFEAFTGHDLPEGVEPNLEATVTRDPPNFTFPFGTHIAVVEIDEETGATELLRYVAVDDVVGNQIKPMIVEGQIHGGIAQGVARAFFEEAAYDDSGNLLNPTLADYLVPSAVEYPSFELGSTVTPSPTNPLGVKGVGEAGCIASPPAAINAVVDSLSVFGVEQIDMPASPEKILAAIQSFSSSR